VVGLVVLAGITAVLIATGAGTPRLEEEPS
jgi:hypothetical protein